MTDKADNPKNFKTIKDHPLWPFYFHCGRCGIFWHGYYPDQAWPFPNPTGVYQDRVCIKCKKDG